MRTFTEKVVGTIAAAAILLSSVSVQAFAEEQEQSADTADIASYDVSDSTETGEYTNVITFTDTAVTSENNTGVNISGTELTIKEAGTYKITGSCSEGNIKVKKGTTGVTVVLSDLTLTSSQTAPFAVNKEGAQAVIVVEGTNTLTDAEDPANETSTDAEVADAFEGAAIKVKSGSKLTITGTGTLTLNAANCKNGLKGAAKAEVIIGESTSDSFTLNINAKKNALASDGSVVMNGGNVSLVSLEDGLKSSPDETDTESAGTVTVNGGTLTISCGEDGIQGDNAVSINGGTLNISSGDDGIHSEYVTDIGTRGSTTGPEINITNSCEGIEGAVVNLYSGTANVVSSDDGMNAANGDLSNYSFAINIYGGKWYINAGGDGLDSNGDINVYGGYTEVFGSTQNDNAALDYGDNNNKFVFEGGTIVGIGMSGMATVPTSGTYVSFGQSGGMGGGGQQPGGEMPGGGGQQPGGEMPGGGGQQPGTGGQQPGTGGQTGTAISVTAGTLIAIKDSSGNTVYSATAPKAANHIVFASDTLVSGGTYTLYLNGTEAATATVGESGGQVQPPQPPEEERSVLTVGTDARFSTVYEAVAAIGYAQKFGFAESAYTIKLTGDVTETKAITLPDIPITITADSAATLNLKSSTLTAKNDLTVTNITLVSGAKAKSVNVTAKKAFTAENSSFGTVKVAGHAEITGCTINGALTLSEKTGTTSLNKDTVTGKITAASALVLSDCASVGAINAKSTLEAVGTDAAAITGAITVKGAANLKNVSVGGKITATDSLSMSTCTVTGAVTAKGNATLRNCTINGKLTCKSDLYLSGSNTVVGDVSTLGITSDDDGNVLSYTTLSVTKNGVLAGSHKLTLRVISITDKKTFTYKTAELDPASKKTNTAVKKFKGTGYEQLLVSEENCKGASLAVSGTKLIVTA